MAKTHAEGKKVVIRRLPPGMTADECWAILGAEWKVGKGLVDWARYDDGEISNESVLSAHSIITSSYSWPRCG